MKLFKVLLMIPLVAMVTACSSDSDDNGNGTPAAPTQPGGNAGGEEEDQVIMVQVEKLADGNNQFFMQSETLEFGKKTNADPIYNEEKVYRVKNSGEVPVNFTMALVGGTSFAIVDNECGPTLASDESCDVRIEFDGGAEENGEIRDAILFTATLTGGIPGIPGTGTAASDNVISLPLMGELDIQGNDVSDDADDDGTTELAIAIAAPFQEGAEPLQEVTITNTGSDVAENLMVEVEGDYMIFAQDCPAHLQEGASCSVYVLYNDYTDLETDDASQGNLRISSDRSNTYSLSLTGGDVVEEDQENN